MWKSTTSLWHQSLTDIPESPVWWMEHLFSEKKKKSCNMPLSERQDEYIANMQS